MDINIFGVYISPMTGMIIVAIFATMVIIWLFDRFNVMSKIWHPSLFVVAIYVVVLSSIIVVSGY